MKRLLFAWIVLAILWITPAYAQGPPRTLDVPRGDVLLWKKSAGVVPTIRPFHPSANTDAARGTALRAALAAASAGDEVLLGPGRYDCGSSTKVDFPAGVTVRGSGIDVTVLNSDKSGEDGDPNVCFELAGDGCKLFDLTIEADRTDKYLYPLGHTFNSANAVTTNAVLTRVRVDGSSDAVYFWGNNSGTGYSLSAFECQFDCNYDAFVDLASNTNCRYTFVDCGFLSNGTFKSDTRKNIVVVRAATAQFFHCRFVNAGSGGGSTQTYAAWAYGNSGNPPTPIASSAFTGNLLFHQCFFDVASVAGSNTEIYKSNGTGTVTVVGGYSTRSGQAGKIQVSNPTATGTVQWLDSALEARTITATAPLTIGGGASATLGADRTLAMPAAASGQNGYLTSTDWAHLDASRTRGISIACFGPTETVTTGDGKFYFHCPSSLNGKDIISVHALVVTAGTTGTTDVQIARIRAGTPADVLSTKLTIDSTETGSDTAAAAAVINTSNDDLQTNDILRVDVDAVSTTPPAGLIITIQAK